MRWARRRLSPLSPNKTVGRDGRRDHRRVWHPHPLGHHPSACSSPFSIGGLFGDLLEVDAPAAGRGQGRCLPAVRLREELLDAGIDDAGRPSTRVVPRTRRRDDMNRNRRCLERDDHARRGDTQPNLFGVDPDRSDRRASAPRPVPATVAWNAARHLVADDETVRPGLCRSGMPRRSTVKSDLRARQVELGQSRRRRRNADKWDCVVRGMGQARRAQ